MVIYLGADHRGFNLKEGLEQFLKESGYTVVDLGNTRYEEGDDYTDFVKSVAGKVSADPLSGRGIVACGSGVGADIVANRFKFVRSVLGFSPDQAADSRHDDDTNVLSLAADYLDLDQAKKIVSAWLQTPFSGEERYKRRIQEIDELGYTSN